MRRYYGAIQSSGGEVLIISFESKARLAQLARQMRLPFPLLSDPERDVYRGYGLVKGSWTQVLGPKTAWTYLKLLLRGRRYHFQRSDLRQLGGDFVIDREGVVRYEYRSAQPEDRPSIANLLEALSAI
ncbi:MAG: hypothetical protein BZY73_03670 [SAR202 cluster bacterium Casp-Chloro-G3]|nr:MAG: hypothetical protein BZY73_03670 [SAR202 cluster bacterium Casp-Chloro-G3]